MNAGLRATLVGVAFAGLTMPLARVAEPDTRALAMLAAQTETPDIAIIGDSRPHAGIAPRVLTDVLARDGLPGLSAHNYGENGTDALHHHNFVVTALLARPRPPRVIVWATHPLSFDGSRRNNRLDQLDPAALPSLARAGAPVEMLLDVATMAFFPPYRARPQLKAGVELTAEKGAFALGRRQTALGLSFEVRPERRASRSFPDGQDPFVVLRDWESGFELARGGYQARYDKLALGEPHFRLAEEMADRARAAGVVLVILEMPVAPAYRESFASLPLHREWRERVARMAREHGAIWMPHADYSNDDHAFGDPAHMQEPLAEEYTQFLARALERDGALRAALSE